MTKLAKDQTKEKGATRREFFGIAWLVSSIALFGQFLVGLFTYIEPNMEGGFGGVLRAGHVDEFAPDSVNLVQAGRFYLVRYEDGSFIAFWQRCTHLGCTVPYEAESREFRCPCHGSVFDQQGQVIGGPAPRPMDIFPVEIRDGEVYVDTGNPIERRDFDIEQTIKA